MRKFKTAAILLIPVSLLAAGINVDEIKKAGPIEFEDFKGPETTRSSHEEITGIGKNLKKGLKGEKYSWMDKYSIVHAVDEKTDKLNADIFIIEKKAGVDKIFNVRRILAGYLQEAYGYSYADAFTLATFITYYNAVYRSNMEYFKKMYSPKVLGFLTPETAGIAISYKEWSGKTSMLIPLSNANTRLDTTNITDEKVIKNLQKTSEDKGVPERKQIVEIKKEELKKDEKVLEKKKEETVKKEKEIQKKEEDLDKKKKAVENIENKTVREAEKKELAKQENALNTEKKEVEKKKEEIKTEEKKLDEKQAEIKKDEAGIKKDENLNELKKNPEKAVAELEKTQQQLEEKTSELKKEQDSVMGGKIYYLKVKEWEMDGHYDDDLVIIDPATRKVAVRSPVKRIDCNKYLINEKGVVVILHNESSPSEHNMVLLDKDKLTLIKKGKENVFWRSFIEDRDGFIYVVVTKDDGFYLGRFNYNLDLETISTVKMDKDSFISFFEDTIFINRSDKAIVVLSKKDLSFIQEIQP